MTTALETGAKRLKGVCKWAAILFVSVALSAGTEPIEQEILEIPGSGKSLSPVTLFTWAETFWINAQPFNMTRKVSLSHCSVFNAYLSKAIDLALKAAVASRCGLGKR